MATARGAHGEVSGEGPAMGSRPLLRDGRRLPGPMSGLQHDRRASAESDAGAHDDPGASRDTVPNGAAPN